MPRTAIKCPLSSAPKPSVSSKKLVRMSCKDSSTMPERAMMRASWKKRRLRTSTERVSTRPETGFNGGAKGDGPGAPVRLPLASVSALHGGWSWQGGCA
jgi:hypothetical protein